MEARIWSKFRAFDDEAPKIVQKFISRILNVVMFRLMDHQGQGTITAEALEPWVKKLLQHGNIPEALTGAFVLTLPTPPLSGVGEGMQSHQGMCTGVNRRGHAKPPGHA